MKHLLEFDNFRETDDRDDVVQRTANTAIRLVLKANFPQKFTPNQRKAYVEKLVAGYKKDPTKEFIVKFLTEKYESTGFYFSKDLADKLAVKIKEILN